MYDVSFEDDAICTFYRVYRSVNSFETRTKLLRDAPLNFSAPLGVNFFSSYTPPVLIFCHLEGDFFSFLAHFVGEFCLLSRFEGEFFFFLKLPNHPLDIYWCVPYDIIQLFVIP